MSVRSAAHQAWCTAIRAHDLKSLDRLLTPSEQRPMASILAEMAHRSHVWFFAVQHGSPDVLERLAPHVNTRMRNEANRTPLYLAAAKGRADNVHALLSRWGAVADLTAQDNDRRNALYVAVVWGHTAVAELLLDRYRDDLGDPTMADQAFALAIEHRQTACADTLAVTRDLPDALVTPKVNALGVDLFPQWTRRREAQALRATLDDLDNDEPRAPLVQPRASGRPRL